MPRIGINALYLIPGCVGGTETYLRSILTALANVDDRHEFFVYTNSETGHDLLPSSPRFHQIRTGVKARFRPGRILYEQTILPKLLHCDGIRVLFNPGFTGPVSFGNASVTVFHDVQHKRHPEFFRWFDLPFWKLLLWATAAQSRSLVAVSHATAADLLQFYPVTRGKITVIHHGVDAEFFRIAARRSAATASEPLLLTVSTLHPHKNIDRLLHAFREFSRAHPEFRLVVAGLEGFAAKDLTSERRKLELDDRVRFTGWIPREELYQLFETADAFIAPSRFEGFGMPLIEALAAGLPTACSSIRPFQEIAGDVVERFAPDSVNEMVKAMTKITGNLSFRSRARVAGPAQARLFDWNRAARLTLDVLEATMAS